MEYHAPFVFPRVPGAHETPLRFVVGYQSGERSGAVAAHFSWGQLTAWWNECACSLSLNRLQALC